MLSFSQPSINKSKSQQSIICLLQETSRIRTELTVMQKNVEAICQNPKALSVLSELEAKVAFKR
jgi:hypothetical protein